MSNLVVMFPGLGYTNDKPLLYYGKKLANAAGYDDCHPVKFGVVNKTGLQGNPEKMMEVYKRLYKTAVKSLAEIEWTKYDKILFISKSIGTVVAACFAREKGIDAKQIYFSPLVHFGMYAPNEGIAFYGDADPLADADEIEKICADKKIAAYRISGGNHSLETGDTDMDLKNLSMIMDRVKEYIMR